MDKSLNSKTIPESLVASVSKSVFIMANYIKITGNKEKTISDFIREQKKYWFVTTDKFTGIRTFQYKTSDDLKEEIKELVNYLEKNQAKFKQTDNCISLKSEYVDIHYASETVC